ncbi:acyl-CoA synthetase FdrA [Pseudonocardia acaciae]|uniref:acyl-CoA synthetase FdrA n=1 Tax=Pseudonocardia acaciae TaxID=551276 RepID=UPI000A924424|nr:acyl-CoA synthetase FdrA [Pseudonocardia acaciae]
MTRPNSYFDSVFLMRVAAEVGAHPGIRTASLVMATEANKQVLATANLLGDDARDAGPNDLVIAVEGEEAALEPALALAEEAFRSGPRPPGDTAPLRPRTVARAAAGANLAMISTPGRYATAEALKALRGGLHVFLFSDNVPVEDEVLLKQEAQRRDLLVMGPDCGTAVVNGVPLGFANRLRRGEVGLVGASGTGLQQVSALLDAGGAGVSQVIGVGGRDLSEEVGGISTLAALAALADDPATRIIGIVAKPPATPVAEKVLAQAAGIGKPVVVNFLGTDLESPSDSVRLAPTLEATAAAILRASGGAMPPAPARPTAAELAGRLGGGRRLLRGLYAGGTFAYEARILLKPALGEIAHSVESPPRLPARHTVLDLGDDRFTVGRPHPMIDPTTRLELLRAALNDPETGVILLDIVLGHGAGPDPAGALAPAIAGAPGSPVVIAFVVGTEDDPQGLAAQRRTMAEAGAIIASNSSDAALLAGEVLTR